MCGIVGLVGAPDPRIVTKMTKTLVHRGPDSFGIFCPEGEGFGLGATRLAILDLSSAGNQPMGDASGRYWITYNGEVYNFRELRSDLEKRGTVFRTQTDTEVVLAAYETWGSASLERLNGMFAFAIFDRLEKRLFAARDRIGIKPLYWARAGGVLLFASEIKAILASGLIAPVADPEALHNPWHYPTAPYTGFKGIEKLPPGHHMLWQEGRVAVRKWWGVEARPEHREENHRADELASLIERAVREQMLSDVPVGAMLSGGLDSSTIVTLMQREVDRPINTFSIAFRTADRRLEASADDGIYARMIARTAGCDHRELEVTPDVVQLLPKLVWHLDEPIADPAAINTYLIGAAAREAGVLVLLSGIGADEIFGGYRKHLACLLADKYCSLLPAAFRHGVEIISRRLPVAGRHAGFRRARWLKRFLGFASMPQTDRFLASDLSMLPSRYEEVYADSSEHPYATLQEVTSRRKSVQGEASYLTRMCLSDTALYLPDHNLAYADKATMAAGVECRPPLVDHRIVEYAFSLPDRDRIRGITQKWLLRQASRRWLPRSIVNRPKSPFSAPLRAWVRRDLQEMVDDLLSLTALRKRGLYNSAKVRQLIEEDRSGLDDNSHLVWNLLSRELWLRTFIDTWARAPERGESYKLQSPPPLEVETSESEPALRQQGITFRSVLRAKKRLLAVVQLPPPVHGVSAMNEAVVKSKSIRDTFDVDVIPIRFASSSADIGRFTMRKIALTISVAMKLAVICARRSPDLVYFTLVPIGAAFYRDLLFVGIVKLYRIPLVYHLHGRGIREAGRSRFNQRIYEWVFDKATIVHLSQRLYSDIERFVPPERCVFLSNGVEDMGTTPRQADRHAGADSVRLLFLSNMKVLKGPLVFLEALALLRKWNVNCHAVFVGPWSERGCEEMFIRMVGSEHLEEMVSYLGPKYGKEKFVVLRESDIFVFPTLHPWESFPLVVLEAMSVGKPVVATRTGAIEDMVENGVTGLLSPPGDVEALSRALEMLIRDSEMRVQMGENGRKRYLERFTLERFEEGITSILRRAATSANTASFKSDGPGVPPP